ncbi:hypothetical protein Tco_1459376 [Tanacetum coccineum]
MSKNGFDGSSNSTLGRTTKSSPFIGAAQPGITCIAVDKSVENAFSFTPGQNVVKSGGSVLDVMEDIIRVGQVMGYSMEGCVKDLENIIGKQGEDNVIR